MKANEVRELTTKELEERLVADQDQLTKVKINHTITPLDNPSQMKEMRKNIARIKTELQQRKSKVAN